MITQQQALEALNTMEMNAVYSPPALAAAQIVRQHIEQSAPQAAPVQAADIAFRLRIARLLAEFNGESILSEQQCAKYMQIDLVSWRKLCHCFSGGTSFVEGADEEFPAEDSESILRAALAEAPQPQQEQSNG